MTRRFQCLIIFLVMMVSSLTAEATIEIIDTRATPEYWISRSQNGDNILMTPQQIARINSDILTKDEYAADLANYPAILSADEVNSLLQEAEYKHYTGAHNVRKDVVVRYAVTTQRGDIRLLPSFWDGSNYDELQGTAIDPAEAVAVLLNSSDGRFVFVQSRYYIGWLDKSKVAFTDRNTWLTYINPRDFLVVTKNKRPVRINGQNILFQMGAVIPLKSNKLTKNNYWLTRFPTSVNGKLKERDVYIFNSGLNKGFLPFTENNLIRQSFKFLGDVYGWGGLQDSVDCSAFVQNVYRSMGLIIPRDADRQDACMPIWAVFNNVDEAERLDIFKRAPVGSLIFKPTHVMVKLGNDDNGTPILIHAASSYFSGGNKFYIRKVVVSDLQAVDFNVIGIGYYGH